VAAWRTKAGIGAGRERAVLRSLEALTRTDMGSMPACYLSHPKTEERIAAIEALEARWSEAQLQRD